MFRWLTAMKCCGQKINFSYLKQLGPSCILHNVTLIDVREGALVLQYTYSIKFIFKTIYLTHKCDLYMY